LTWWPVRTPRRVSVQATPSRRPRAQPRRTGARPFLRTGGESAHPGVRSHRRFGGTWLSAGV